MIYCYTLIAAQVALQTAAPPHRPPPVPPRTISFSGYEWTVKRSEGPVGPGPNCFSDDPENVFVDEQGRLHLKISVHDGKWRCAEVVSKQSFGYGAYRFELASPIRFDPWAVWGLFTWHTSDPAYHHREIDIEFGRWGRTDNQNAQFVVQPYTPPQNIVRFNVVETLEQTTHLFTWRRDRIDFQSVKGAAVPPAPGDLLCAWTYSGKGLPAAGGENVRINLWLMGGRSPQDSQTVEVIVRRFAFAPVD